MPECEGALTDSMTNRVEQLRLDIMTAFGAVELQGGLRTGADHTWTCRR